MYYGCGFPIGKGFGFPTGKGFGGWPATMSSGFSKAIPVGGGFINPFI